MRRAFKPILLNHFRRDPNLRLITGDLGYRFLDEIATEFPDRFYNVGAAECLAVGAAIGMAQEGLTPIVYSITPFLLWRPAEWLRNYVEHEKAGVKLLGAGRGADYAHDGYTHECGDDKDILKLFPSIRAYWPESEDELERVAEEWLKPGAAYLNLRR